MANWNVLLPIVCVVEADTAYDAEQMVRDAFAYRAVNRLVDMGDIYYEGVNTFELDADG